MKEITDEMFYKLVDYKMSEPIPLLKADLNIPFIYDRNFGVFYVDSGMHILGMALLYCWKFDCNSKRDLLIKRPELKEDMKNCFGIDSQYQFLADKFLLESKGAAMGSSVSNYILIGNLSNLNEQEKIIFSRYEIRELNG